MKVIRKDNFDRETRSDRLIAAGLSDVEAKKLADKLNAEADPHGEDFFSAVPDNYKLFQFEP